MPRAAGVEASDTPELFRSWWATAATMVARSPSRRMLRSMIPASICIRWRSSTGWGWSGWLPALRRGRHGQKRSVEALRATEFEIQTDVPLELNVDGEIWGQTPAHCRVIPRALEVFAPMDPA